MQSNSQFIIYVERQFSSTLDKNYEVTLQSILFDFYGLVVRLCKFAHYIFFRLYKNFIYFCQ